MLTFVQHSNEPLLYQEPTNFCLFPTDVQASLWYHSRHWTLLLVAFS